MEENMKSKTRFGDSPEAIETDKLSKEREQSYLRRNNLRRLRCFNGMALLRGRRVPMGDGVPDFDHPSTYKEKDTGATVAVFQPYACHTKKEGRERLEAKIAARAQEYAAKNGLVARVSREESWHFPGETVLIEYRKREGA